MVNSFLRAKDVMILFWLFWSLRPQFTFYHIKCSSSKSESDKSNSSGEVNSVNSSVSSKEDNMQSSSNEDDAGGGGDSAFPDESCESVLVNGISVLLAILEA